jgi:hypothetical protein
MEPGKGDLLQNMAFIFAKSYLFLVMNKQNGT